MLGVVVMKLEVQIIGIALLIVVPLILIWGAWYYVFNPLIKNKKKKGEKITLKDYLVFALISIAFLSIGFLFFYVNGYWKLIPFLLLVAFYFLIKR